MSRPELTDFQIRFLMVFYAQRSGYREPPKDIEEIKRRNEADERRRKEGPHYICCNG